jgi:hypothetical protein
MGQLDSACTAPTSATVRVTPYARAAAASAASDAAAVDAAAAAG